MEDIWLLICGLALLIGQVVCLFAKKVWVRLIPVFIAVALLAFCIIMYILSSFTNWGYLILLLMVLFLLGTMGLVWLVYGIVRQMRKNEVNDCLQIRDIPWPPRFEGAVAAERR